ncbi:unnamed protein product [Medioppia subpectinata]|uniref:Cytochrome P450 n=1 Tax=Medioppia subpectinata TaxID=1979941 RepID=A0A7R9QIB2_9ACAR|nr:unnamed protein product [Medioppia subpectinata]CAG2121317.1 unnamed protein product [Medioppia subpectinata]
MTDTTIDKYRIEKNTLVISNLWAIHMDPNVWQNPEVFDPKRFVTRDGSFRAKMPGFAPFGIGRRVCLGEKLALADLFLITVRLLQSTNECVFALQAGDGSAHLEPEPNVILFCAPKPYEIILKGRKNFY